MVTLMHSILFLVLTSNAGSGEIETSESACMKLMEHLVMQRILACTGGELNNNGMPMYNQKQNPTGLL